MGRGQRRNGAALWLSLRIHTGRRRARCLPGFARLQPEVQSAVRNLLGGTRLHPPKTTIAAVYGRE